MGRIVVPIVEGHGEVSAVPVLIRRILLAHDSTGHLDIRAPIRLPRGKFVNGDELGRVVELAARASGPDGSILILLDSDGDCPVGLANTVRRLARDRRTDRDIRVVVAVHEYETWFIAGIESLAGRRGLRPGLSCPENFEEVTDAKGWLSRHSNLGQPYRETIDQPALSATLDIASARASRSFDKLYREIIAIYERR